MLLRFFTGSDAISVGRNFDKIDPNDSRVMKRLTYYDLDLRCHGHLSNFL